MPEAGVEPAYLSAGDFKSPVSTISPPGQFYFLSRENLNLSPQKEYIVPIIQDRDFFINNGENIRFTPKLTKVNPFAPENYFHNFLEA